MESVVERGFSVCFYLKAGTHLSMLVMLKEKSQEKVTVESMRGMELRA